VQKVKRAMVTLPRRLMISVLLSGGLRVDQRGCHSGGYLFPAVTVLKVALAKKLRGATRSFRSDAYPAHIGPCLRLHGQLDHYASRRWAWVQTYIPATRS
jgi:hypothetical protein